MYLHTSLIKGFVSKLDTIYLMCNYDNFQCGRPVTDGVVRGQVFPGAGVFISQSNILIPFTSDYTGDID